MSELNEKWRRLVKAGKAEWVEGMLRIAPDPATANPWDDGARLERYEEAAPYIEGWSDGPWYPVWSDPATLGALVGQVEARYAGPVWVFWIETGECSIRVQGRWFAGLTKAAALLDALETAP